MPAFQPDGRGLVSQTWGQKVTVSFVAIQDKLSTVKRTQMEKAGRIVKASSVLCLVAAAVSVVVHHLATLKAPSNLLCVTSTLIWRKPTCQRQLTTLKHTRQGFSHLVLVWFPLKVIRFKRSVAAVFSPSQTFEWLSRPPGAQ